MTAASIHGDDDEDNGIIDIDEIQNHGILHHPPFLLQSLISLGIGASDISKLKANGIHTVGSLLSTTTKKLLRIKGFSDTKVEKIKEAAKKTCASILDFTTVIEIC
ncbi:hypothetical protein M430DRAFT_27635 [Amorphotheca resinae ATCC 22711]|uniref:DNA recombination and repair protein Rad51-like C-terminal domain-containing protein n=1 Tax=Amorphotheca resinae ATCC 22711 TaxID=857342 RepID=A0A2T3B4R0_AMORE|nr:hypothetical protein M430DRAFT_27635 [Amorphotheca resinae ATCC 22711]PSS20608.1 hypothetical protein M430DRAFT_27635 [Amorphotheca resinae ATCC 22711]